MALLQAFCAAAQKKASIITTVVDARNGKPVEGAFVQAPGYAAFTDELGRVVFSTITIADSLRVSALGFEVRTIALKDLSGTRYEVALLPDVVQLQEMTLLSAQSKTLHGIGKIDITMGGLNNAQEILHMVPGLFIGQHAGGGKAEQIFLRGFDIDHGTDVAISAD